MKGHQLNGPVPHTHVQVLLLWCRVHGTWSHADMSDLRQNEEGAMFIEAVTHSHKALAQKLFLKATDVGAALILLYYFTTILLYYYTTILYYRILY